MDNRTLSNRGINNMYNYGAYNNISAISNKVNVFNNPLSSRMKTD